jgi:hypothetical protein
MARGERFFKPRGCPIKIKLRCTRKERRMIIDESILLAINVER